MYGGKWLGYLINDLSEDLIFMCRRVIHTMSNTGSDVYDSIVTVGIGTVIKHRDVHAPRINAHVRDLCVYMRAIAFS